MEVAMSVGSLLKPYNGAWNSWYREHDRVSLEVKRGRTKQEFKDECDLNVLMKRYEKTGVLPGSRVGQPQFVDVSEMPDFQGALQIVQDAERMFMALPARVRGEFDNDPGKFVEFAQNAENIGRLRELGLAEPEPVEPPPQRVEVVNPPEKSA